MSDKYNHWLPKWMARRRGRKDWAITISSETTLYSLPYVDIDPAWRHEEDEHKRRIKAMGWFNFMATYIWQIIVKGYDKMDLETSAKEKR